MLPIKQLLLTFAPATFAPMQITLSAVVTPRPASLPKAVLNSPVMLGNHCRQSQQSRMEFGRGLSRRFSGRTTWIVDAHRDDGKRFIVHADEKLTAFLEAINAFNHYDIVS
jgi:hypothetical protein